MRYVLGLLLGIAGVNIAFQKLSASYPLFLTNYGAIEEDRFKAELASWHFSIIIEQSHDMGKYMLRLNPQLQVLSYVSACETRPYYPFWEDSLNQYELTFMHSYDPASLSFFKSGDTLYLYWAQDRRFDDVAGYIIRLSSDSLSQGVVWNDTLFTGTHAALTPITLGHFLHLETVRIGGDTAWYSAIWRIDTLNSNVDHMGLESIVFTKGPPQDSLNLWFYVSPESYVDSIKVQVDIDRNFNFSEEESFVMTHIHDTLFVASISWETDTNRSGVAFRFCIYRGSEMSFFPTNQDHVLLTTVNNRIVNLHNAYVMNVSNRRWERYVIRLLWGFLNSPNYNGAFIDNATISIQEWMLGMASLPFDYDSTAWAKGMRELLDSVYSVTHQYGNTYFNGLADDSSITLLTHVDGGLFEGYIYAPWWSGLSSFGNWRRCQNQVINTRRMYNKIFLALSRIPAVDTNSRIFTYASYLLVADDSVFFGNAERYFEFGLFPEMMLPVGRPLETASDDIDELRSPEGAYIRHFENGTVVVNPYDEQEIILSNTFPSNKVVITPGTVIDGSRLFTVAYNTQTLILPPKTAIIFMNFPILPVEIDSISYEPNPPTCFGVNDIMVGIGHSCVADAEAIFKNLELNIELYDDGTHGDATPNDGVYSSHFVLPVGIPPVIQPIYIWVKDSCGFSTVKCDSIEPVVDDPSNKVYNWSFEIDINEDSIPDGWEKYGNGFEYHRDSANTNSGFRSIKCYSLTDDSAYGAYQTIYLNQEFPAPVIISGYSKAESVGGESNKDYSIYADVYCVDGSVMHGECAIFPTGTHGWVYAKHYIEPKAPIERISLVACFKYHTGTVWFDDVGVYTTATMPVEEEGRLKLDDLDFDFIVIPNPVKGEGIIRAYVPGTKAKELKLYDCTGRLAELFELHPGLNEIIWDARHLPNGTYFFYSTDPRKVVKTLILR